MAMIVVVLKSRDRTLRRSRRWRPLTGAQSGRHPTISADAIRFHPEPVQHGSVTCTPPKHEGARPMATRTVTIASSVGLHARPAALFVQAAGEHRPRRRDRQVPARTPSTRRASSGSWPWGQVRRGGRADRRGRRRRRGARLASSALSPRPRRGVRASAGPRPRRPARASGSARGTAYGPVVQVAPPVRPPADEAAVDDRRPRSPT